MVEMDSLPKLQIGNALVPLCPICYELTFGFSSIPEEQTSGVKRTVVDPRRLLNSPKFEEEAPKE